MSGGYPTVEQASFAWESPRGPVESTEGDAEYEYVEALASAQALGASGTAGDYLKRLVLIPTSVNPGGVSIKDGSASAISVFAGGTSAVADLKSWTIDLGLESVNGAWQITTGTAIAVLACGDFT